MDMIIHDEKQKILTSSTTMLLKDMKTEVVIILKMAIKDVLDINLDMNTRVTVIPSIVNLDVNTLVMSAQSMNTPGASIPSMNIIEKILNMIPTANLLNVNTTAKILNMNTTAKIRNMNSTAKILNKNSTPKILNINTTVKINAKLKFKTASLVGAIKIINSRVDDVPTMLQVIRVGLVSSFPNQLLFRIVADLLATKITCLEGRKELWFKHS